MRCSARHEHRITGAKFEQLSVQAKVVVALDDDESLIVGWVPVIASASFGWFDRFADVYAFQSAAAVVLKVIVMRPSRKLLPSPG